MTTANEGPVESPSTFAQYRVMQEARDHGITVLLDGQGADETWSGYEKYAGAAVLDRLAHGQLGSARRLRRDWQTLRGAPLPVAPARYGAMVAPPALRRAMSRMAALHNPSWLAAPYRRRYGALDPLGGLGPLRARFGNVGDTQALLDLGRITLPRLLRYADRNSMAWSREVRLPFLDHRLVELAVRTPFAAKVVDGWTKAPLRRLLEQRGLPETAWRRDKLAYMPPTAEWLGTPKLEARVAEAWAALHTAGVLAGPEPAGSAGTRWRVLAVHQWADQFGVGLREA
jgi:asparagine synthase (glutamine-hydrolysing)